MTPSLPCRRGRPDPSPPVGGKGDQPRQPQQRPMRWNPPPPGGVRGGLIWELEEVSGYSTVTHRNNDHHFCSRVNLPRMNLVVGNGGVNFVFFPQQLKPAAGYLCTQV